MSDAKKPQVYFHDWSDADGMLHDFGVPASTLAGKEVLLASYTYQEYSGNAFVLFRDGDKLYEVNGGHCSCYGLRESTRSGGGTQWEPEQTTKEALMLRLGNGINAFASIPEDHVKAVLDTL